MAGFLGVIGSISEMERNNEELSVAWDIPNFFKLSARGGDFCGSPDFYFNGARWCLDMFTNGSIPNIPSKYVNLYLQRRDKGSPMTIQYTFSISNKHGLETKIKGEHTFSEALSVMGCTEFLSRDALRNYHYILRPDRVLRVRCIMKNVKNVVCSPVESESFEDTDSETDGEIEESNPCTRGSKLLNKQGCEKVHEDFAKLLASGEDSDVTVQVGDVKLEAHRAILSARCPVLSAMFRHETEERATNSVKIDDCEPDVFRDFLKYLYTGSVQSHDELDVFGLHRVADKYLADDLKEQCLEHIRNTICVQTFCATVQLALTHGESGLLGEAIAFATENIRSIIRSVEWQNFSRDYPTEANEILIKSLGPPS